MNSIIKLFKGMWSLISGMMITLKYMFKKSITVKYPYEKIDISKRWRGVLKQLKNPEGEEICDGCGICAKTCPVNCITMQVYKDELSGKRKTSSFTIDFGRCMFCGLCVESCPKKCIVHSTEYELAVFEKKDMIFTKDRILK